jgi:hypothetical protein
MSCKQLTPVGSAGTVKRRCKVLGLKGSRAKEIDSLPSECEQLVLKQLDDNPANRHGVRTIVAKVAYEEDVHLSRYGD